MRNKFNKTKYNINMLKPTPESIEKNKCTHEVFAVEDGSCLTCGVNASPKKCLNPDKLIEAKATMIEHLQCMKMVANSCLSKKEIKAAQKYFDMIPLLEKIDVLYNICADALDDHTLDDVTDLYDELEYVDDDEDFK